MNHLKQIAEKLPEYGLDAMLITSEPGERYAIGFHGEGLLLVTREEAHYTTDGRYIEAAQEQIQGADVKLITPDSGHLAQARAFLEERGLHNVGFESGSVTVDAHRRYSQKLPCILTPAQQLLDDLLSVVNKALAGFDAMRTTEGKALENDLRSRGETILGLVSQVEAGNAQTVIDYRTRLENKLREVLENTAIDESRILTEAAIFADKVAVDEETVRLRSHLAQMNTMLTSGGAIGRKLDFLLQEMNRETNTIGSKCTDVRLARVVVEIKAELEKIREQTQNIE